MRTLFDSIPINNIIYICEKSDFVNNLCHRVNRRSMNRASVRFAFKR